MGYAQGEGDIADIVNRAQAEVYNVAEKRGGEDYHVLGEILEKRCGLTAGTVLPGLPSTRLGIVRAR